MDTKKLQSRLRGQVDHLKEQLLGFELMRLAGEKAVEAGEAEGAQVFEEYSWSMGHDIRLMSDAELLGRSWARTHSVEDFASCTDGYSSQAGRLAAQCLLKHYHEIKVDFGSFKERGWEAELDEAENSSPDLELITETGVYEMLLRGDSPQAVEFQAWVTDEVLPTIRATGKYDHDQTMHSISKGFFTEVKA